MSPEPLATSVPRGPWSIGVDSNAFALTLFAQLRQQGGNLFVSPHSLRAALGMTYAGARGETAAQMRDVLQLPSPDETVHTAFAEVDRWLTAAGGAEVELAAANSLWGQDGAPPVAAYLDLIARHYGGVLNLVDFRHADEAARVRINGWVEEKTRQKIRDLIPAGGLSADTRLVLVNAIYFRGRWHLSFEKSATRDAPFYLEGGAIVEAPLMHQLAELLYMEEAEYQAVDLAYRGGAMSMLVLLPRRRDGIESLERSLSPRMLRDCLARMETRDVRLFLPRFKIAWGADMRANLTALGMPLAFDRARADLSGINGRAPPDEESLFISGVAHKAVAEVDERGTEAAAATALDVMLDSAGPERPQPVALFRADHPFLFAIRERRSGVILFLGRVADPTKES